MVIAGSQIIVVKRIHFLATSGNMDLNNCYIKKQNLLLVDVVFDDLRQWFNEGLIYQRIA